MIRQQPFSSPGEALEHHGVKGMHWGQRRVRSVGPTQSTSKKRIVKRAAVGVSAVALTAGAGFVAYKLAQSGHMPISSIKAPSDNVRLANDFLSKAGLSPHEMAEASKFAEALLKSVPK